MLIDHHSSAIPLGLGVINLVGTDLTSLLQVTGPVLIAIGGGWWATRQARIKAGSDAAASVQSGFKMLIEELQEERGELIKFQDRQARIMDAQSEKISGLEDEIRSLRQQIHLMERALRDANLDLPMVPNRR